MGDMAAVKVLRNALCLIMGYLVAYYVVLMNLLHGMGPINVCTNFEINRYKMDEYRKHAKIISFV